MWEGLLRLATEANPKRRTKKRRTKNRRRGSHSGKHSEQLGSARVARKKQSVLGGLGPFRDNMCIWLTALAGLKYAPDYGDFGER